MVQAACEMIMWNNSYDNREAEYTAILRTKDWNEAKIPTFDYKYLGFDEALQKSSEAYSRLSLCLKTDASYFPEPKSKQFVGSSKLGELPSIEIKSIEAEWGEYWAANQESLEEIINEDKPEKEKS